MRTENYLIKEISQPFELDKQVELASANPKTDMIDSALYSLLQSDYQITADRLKA